MKILAWTVIAIVSGNIISEPFMYGKPRNPYGQATWICTLISAALNIPMCGRILGWW